MRPSIVLGMLALLLAPVASATDPVAIDAGVGYVCAGSLYPVGPFGPLIFMQCLDARDGRICYMLFDYPGNLICVYEDDCISGGLCDRYDEFCISDDDGLCLSKCFTSGLGLGYAVCQRTLSDRSCIELHGPIVRDHLGGSPKVQCVPRAPQL